MAELENADLIDVSVAQDGGVKKRILKEASEGAKGPPLKGSNVTAHYTGECTVAYAILYFCTVSGEETMRTFG